MFLKKKKNGVIKVRGCADGRNRRLYSNNDVRAPTVATEALLLTFVIDTMKRRNVATIDIPGAFLHYDIDDADITVRFDGKMAEILEK